MDGQSFRKNGWPMLSKYAEANAFNTGGATVNSPFGEGRPEAAPIMCSLVLKALASAYFESIGHPFFQKHWPSTYYKGLQPLPREK